MGENHHRSGYLKILHEAEKDDRVVGLILGGSRGKGCATQHSDYDIYIIVRDGTIEDFREKYAIKPGEHQTCIDGNDLLVFTQTEFKNYAQYGTKEEGYIYNFVHLIPTLDKTGEIKQLLEEKQRIPPEKLHDVIAHGIDAYINYLYRSVKCHRDGHEIGARIEANVSMICFQNLIYAMDGGRIAPYGKYFLWEMEHYPLKCIPLAKDELVGLMLKIWNSADIDAQRKLYFLVEEIAKRQGYEKYITDWGEPSLKLIRGS